MEYLSHNKTFSCGVFGLGHFGYALLKHVSELTFPKLTQVVAYDRNKDVLDSLSFNQTHPKIFKNYIFDKEVNYTYTVDEFFAQSDIVIFAVSSSGMKSVFESSKPYLKKKHIVMNTVKALFNDGRRYSELFYTYFPDCSYAVLSGGTIASDLFNAKLLGADLACANFQMAEWLSQVFASSYFKLYPTNDIIGVEYAAAFKNVISILGGICSGMGLCYGTQTYVISRCANEIAKFMNCLYNANLSTFNIGSQCWGNDLWMSCTGNTRNRNFGIMMGKKGGLNFVLEELSRTGTTLEGLKTIKVLPLLLKETKVKDYPLLHGMNNIFNNGESLLKLNHYLSLVI